MRASKKGEGIVIEEDSSASSSDEEKKASKKREEQPRRKSPELPRTRMEGIGKYITLEQESYQLLPVNMLQKQALHQTIQNIIA